MAQDDFLDAPRGPKTTPRRPQVAAELPREAARRPKLVRNPRATPPAHPETMPRGVEAIREVGEHAEKKRRGKPSDTPRGEGWWGRRRRRRRRNAKRRKEEVTVDMEEEKEEEEEEGLASPGPYLTVLGTTGIPLKPIGDLLGASRRHRGRLGAVWAPLEAVSGRARRPWERSRGHLG
eukprot:4673643-Pyramimonas_sp.AAC.1